MITQVSSPHKVFLGDGGGIYGLTITTFGLIMHAAHTSKPPTPRLHHILLSPFPSPPNHNRKGKIEEGEDMKREGGERMSRQEPNYSSVRL